MKLQPGSVHTSQLQHLSFERCLSSFTSIKHFHRTPSKMRVLPRQQASPSRDYHTAYTNNPGIKYLSPASSVLGSASWEGAERAQGPCACFVFVS